MNDPYNYPFIDWDNAELLLNWKTGDVEFRPRDRQDVSYTWAEALGHAHAFQLRNDLHNDTYDAILEAPEVQELIGRVRAGYESRWDGSNWCGRLTDDARTALCELGDLIESHWGDTPKSDGKPGDIEVWEADSWFMDGLDHEFAKGEPLEDLLDRLEAEAQSEGVIVRDLGQYVRAVYSGWVESEEEEEVSE